VVGFIPEQQMTYGNALNFIMMVKVILPRKTNLTNLYIMKLVKIKKMLLPEKYISRVAMEKDILIID